jgi:hypothetical protein
MKTIKQTVVVLLILLVVANVASHIYLGSTNRDVPPEISCPNEVLEVSASDTEEALLVGVTAKDQQDGDLTDRITVGGISKLITRDTAKVTYLVFDSDNNMASAVRWIRYVDYHRPTFEVTEPLVYAASEEVTMLSRLKAIDVVDGDISQNIRVSTLEPTNHTEIFHITVQVSNSLGDTSILTLPVVMLESDPLRPEIQLSDSLIYLEQDSQFIPSAYLLSVRAPGLTPSVADVTVDNGVDTAKLGTYYVTYTYSANGTTGTAVLTVVVQ